MNATEKKEGTAPESKDMLVRLAEKIGGAVGTVEGTAEIAALKTKGAAEAAPVMVKEKMSDASETVKGDVQKARTATAKRAGQVRVKALAAEKAMISDAKREIASVEKSMAKETVSAKKRWAKASQSLKAQGKGMQKQALARRAALVEDARSDIAAAQQKARKEIAAAKRRVASAEKMMAAKARDESAAARALIKKEAKAARQHAAAARKAMDRQVKTVHKNLTRVEKEASSKVKAARKRTKKVSRAASKGMRGVVSAARS